MPKIVDHEERRRDLAEAVVAVASERGLHAATLRAVAERAGLSMGTVQHYFSNRDEMLAFVLRFVQERRSERIRLAIAARTAPGPLEVVESIVDEVLTDDAANRTFERVRVMFLAWALHDEAAAALLRDGPGVVVALLRGLFEGVRAQGRLRADVDPATAAETLWVLLDAVPTSVLLGQRTHEDARALVRGALDDLLVDAPSA